LIRHYGLLARPSCADNIARVRELLTVPTPQDHNADADAVNPNEPPNPLTFELLVEPVLGQDRV